MKLLNIPETLKAIVTHNMGENNTISKKTLQYQIRYYNYNHN